MYIYQLGSGNMLKFEDNKFSVEYTGYPVPDCEMHFGKKVYKGQTEILRQILSYDISDISDFMSRVSKFEPMDFTTFKYTIWRDNIGGSCPKRCQNIGKYIIDNGLTEHQAFFISNVPCVKPVDEIELPDLTEYKDLIFKSWKYKHNKPNKIFKNNILMYTGLKNYSDRYLNYIEMMLYYCMESELFQQFRYITVIKSNNNVGCIIFCDSVSENVDFEFFYTTISKVSLCDGMVKVDVDGENVTISFDCMDKSLKDYYEANAKVFNGTFIRKEFKFGLSVSVG